MAELVTKPDMNHPTPMFVRFMLEEKLQLTSKNMFVYRARDHNNNFISSHSRLWVHLDMVPKVRMALYDQVEWKETHVFQSKKEPLKV
jgi:hypothetical protein